MAPVIEVFGVVGVRADGHPNVIGSRSQRLVLAVLAAGANSVVSADTLIDSLWENDPPPTARRTLGSYVSRLRSVLGDLVQITSAGYRLVATADSLDALRFERLVLDADSATPAAAVPLLQEALSIVAGPAFGEFAHLDPVRGAAVRLDTLVVDARERLVRSLADTGRHTEAAALAAEIVAAHPLRETAWIAIIDAQTRSSPGDALRTFRTAVDELARVGLVPSAALRAAEARALAAESTGAEVDRPRPRPPSRRRSLIGRDSAVSELQALTRTHRLVTLTGPGGVGKTRLAEEIAALVGDDHHLGVRTVLLGDLTEAEAVAPAILETLDLGGMQADPSDLLADVGRLDVLLVVDNCEHVLDAAATAVATVLDGGEHARVVATSRQALGVAGERRWPTAPLGGGDRADAIEVPADLELFLERSRELGLESPLDIETATRIVRRLDGLPLAIEMAAAMSTSHGLDDLDELTRTEPSVLRAPVRGAPDRQRSLGHLVDWSIDQLDPTTNDAVERLTVFDGVFDRRSAAAVVGDGVDRSLHELVERSLLVADTNSGAACYRMLWTIKHHVQGRSSEERRTESARRHALHHLDRVAEDDVALRTDDEAAADARLATVYPEVRNAHLWATAHDPELAGDLSTRLHVWAMSRQMPDSFRWAVRLADHATEVRTGVVAAQSQAWFYAGRIDESIGLAEAALDGATGLDRLLLLESLGDIVLAKGELGRVVDLGRQLADDADALGDAHYVVMGRCAQALGHGYGGQLTDALDVLADTPAAAPTDRGWLAYTEGELIAADHPDGAAGLLATAMRSADAVNNRFLGGVARISLSSLRSRHGDPEASIRDLADTIEHWRDRGMHAYLITSLRNLVVLLDRLDEPTLAARLIGAVDRHARLASFGSESEELRNADDRTRDRLPDGEYERLRADAHRTPFDELVTEIIFQVRGLAD